MSLCNAIIDYVKMDYSEVERKIWHVIRWFDSDNSDDTCGNMTSFEEVIGGQFEPRILRQQNIIYVYKIIVTIWLIIINTN